MVIVVALVAPTANPQIPLRISAAHRHWRVVAASSSAASGVDLKALQTAIDKKDSDDVKGALDQLKELGWAKRWSSQPYVSRRTTSLRELTTLGVKNAENLAIPSVRNDAAFLFTVVGTTGFLAVLAGQLPGVLYKLSPFSSSPSAQFLPDKSRWAVLFAASLLKNNTAAHEALMSAMSQKASVLGCIEAIENAA